MNEKPARRMTLEQWTLAYYLRVTPEQIWDYVDRAMSPQEQQILHNHWQADGKPTALTYAQAAEKSGIDINTCRRALNKLRRRVLRRYRNMQGV